MLAESNFFQKIPDGAPHPKNLLHHPQDDPDPVISSEEVLLTKDACLTELDRLARMAIEMFFKGKEMSCGGEIPDHLLFSQENINRVLNTNLEEGATMAYAAIERNGPVREEWIKDTYSAFDIDDTALETEPDVRLYSKCISEASGFRLDNFQQNGRYTPMAKISRCFVPGLVLLCLKLCYGIEID
jgi:hypothetical protein